MNRNEILQWLLAHNFYEAVQDYMEDCQNGQVVEPFRDLPQKGSASVLITMDEFGHIHMTHAETIETFELPHVQLEIPEKETKKRKS